ncbi:MAG: gamma carbonic anhydrase family protein [Clostridium celatum]|nr:gamma carbonic anhydrase family protein [Clostridium celatum]
MVMEFEGVTPKIDENTYISESVDIIGKVEILENANIWFGTRLRGDMNNIVIGRNTNIQENSVVHVDSKSPCIIGNNVTIGHGAIIHGCNIADNVLVGMGSIILNNAKIGNNTIIGAGSLITQGKEFPEGVLILGNPAKVVRKLTQAEIESIQCSADNYVRLSKKYKK